MLFRLSRLLVVLALSGSIGLHWALLQMVAWTGMIVSYSQNASFTEAVGRTFDGKHPCQLCLKIGEGKKAEKKSDLSCSLKKADYVSERVVFVFNAPQEFTLLPDRSFPLRELAHQPPTPPPRSLPA